MEIQIAPDSLLALKADYPVRCLYREKLSLHSRQPKHVKIWANRLVETLLKSLEGVGRYAATSNKELLMIRIRRKDVLICFDIFPWDFSCQIRHVERSNKPLIHEIYKVDEVYHMRRNRSLDAQVDEEYRRLQGFDKGEQPYFYNVKNPPVYEDSRLLEGFQYGDGTEDNEAEKVLHSSLEFSYSLIANSLNYLYFFEIFLTLSFSVLE
jgi:hypothetical protein